MHLKIMKFKELHNVTGSRIKLLRKQKKITQDQLAARLQTYGIQIDQKAISRLESGQRVVTDYELVQIARILNVSVDDLIQDVVYDRT